MSLSRRLIGQVVFGIGALLALVPAEALAQAKKAAEGASGPSYTLSYFAVVFFVGLGLTVVLRPAGRSTEVKRRRDD